jgi:hypothetical protein
MADTFTDFLGQEVAVGDLVVYATTSGRSPVQKLARVEAIKPFVNTRRRFVNDAWVTDEYTDFKVGVKELNNSRGFIRWDSYDWQTQERDMSRVRVSYPMKCNIVKVLSGT